MYICAIPFVHLEVPSQKLNRESPENLTTGWRMCFSNCKLRQEKITLPFTFNHEFQENLYILTSKSNYKTIIIK